MDSRSGLPLSAPPQAEEERIEARFGYSGRNFAGRLLRSAEAVRRVAMFFERNGVRVEAPEPTLRERMEQIDDYRANECDIALSGVELGFEVKGRPGLVFEGLRDFPYGTVSVDTVSGYEAKVRKPLAYLTVSGDFRSMLVLPTHTYPHWIKETKVDRDRDLRDQFYFAEKHLFESRRWLIDLARALQTVREAERPFVLAEFGFGLT